MSDNKCKNCGQWAGKNHRCPTPTTPPTNTPNTPPPPTSATRDTVNDRVEHARAVIAENTVTQADVNTRMWEREQAERMGYDPDTYAGPVLFTDEEWEAMTSTREARIAFGYELPCGCRPGSCSSEYGGDCYRNGYYDDYEEEALEPYRSLNEVDEDVQTLRAEFQNLQEHIALGGFEASAASSEALIELRGAFKEDRASGPEATVASMERIYSALGTLHNSQFTQSMSYELSDKANNSLYDMQNHTATVIARVKATFPEKFPPPENPWSSAHQTSNESDPWATGPTSEESSFDPPF